MIANTEIEINLVAYALNYPKQWLTWSFVKPDDFVDGFASLIWGKVGSLVIEGKIVDPRLIAIDLYQDKTQQEQCFNTLLDWKQSILTPIGGDDYARIVKDLADRRRLERTANEILDLATNTSCGYTASEIASLGMARISNHHTDIDYLVPVHELCGKVIENAEKIIPCYSTGFKKLDESLGGGFYRNRFYGFGARMKVGKSMLMSSIAYKMAIERGERILYLCLEMGSEESAQRLMAMHMRVNSLDFMKTHIRNQMWFKNKMIEAKETFKKSKLYFRSRPRMALDDLKATIARAGMSGLVDGIIVDYIQLVEGKQKGQSTAEHLDNVAQTLAEAVKRFPIWVLSAAQLNREGSVRGSDGLLMACDLAYSINKPEGTNKAWLETLVSRYTPYVDVGNEFNPAFELDINSGPMFLEI